MVTDKKIYLTYFRQLLRIQIEVIISGYERNTNLLLSKFIYKKIRDIERVPYMLYSLSLDCLGYVKSNKRK